MVTPEEGLGYYRQLCDYVARRVGRPARIVDKRTYAQVNKLVESREVDVAFVCSGPYVDGHEAFGMELLAAPVVNGKATYNCYIIVPRGSTAKSLRDLRGKVFAFTDPDSNTGRLVPMYQLARMGETPEEFFAKLVYTHAHNLSIEAVAERRVDGAAVDGLIWDYARSTGTNGASQTKIIWRSDPFGIPPVVAHPLLDDNLKAQVTTILLDAHRDPDARAILEHMGVDRFTTIDDSAYDSIRRMQAWIRSRGGRP
jgi:phosphonate transport system substrate-binding protein